MAPSAPGAAKGAPPVPHVEVTKEVAQAAPPPAKPPVPKPPRSRGLLIGLGAAAVVLLGGGAFFGYRAFFAAPPPPPPKKAPLAAKPGATVPASGATKTAPSTPAAATPTTPSATLNAIAHTPAKSIEKAQGAAAAQAAGADATNEIVASGETAPAPAATATPAPAAASKPKLTTETTAVELAPGVSSTSSQVAAVSEASPAFRALVANLRITGFVGGASPKALINGRLMHVGDVIDSQLGVTFEGVKADQLIFKDRSGATVQRRY